ncbi:MAG: AI-2E family transporter, partial [Candidatus Saccharibacteria bacterium]|nr:AI-2E family transporter [Pseudorhodobacter sp.]
MSPSPVDQPRFVPSRARITLPGVFGVVVAAVVLKLAQAVFLPLAIAMLITFALSPLVSVLRRTGVSLMLSVLMVTALAFAALGVFSFVVFGQLGELAMNLPIFQQNILTKLDGLQSAGAGDGFFKNAMNMVRAINSEIGAALPAGGAVPAKPLPVEVVENVSAVGLLQNLVMPVISPVATSGLVIVLVIFMLLERESLRERFIRLIGSSDLHRTTQMLGEAGTRVASYLLTQLLVNTIYAVPIGLGLWLIGVPNPLLWGVLTLILRFVPYIGSILAAAFPLFLAFAVSPDWTAVIWTAALFIAVETVTSNAIEPWLYGSRTGLSSLAIIIAALFWTYIWGPPGLVLATPLTVCLVVLGRHIPQFAFFDIMLGDEPALAPHQQLYQRLLVGNRVEAVFNAEESLADQGLGEFYQSIALPALIMAQDDRDRGVLTPEQEARFAETAGHLVEEMSDLLEDEREEAQAGKTADAPSVTCIGGRRQIDDITAIMLSQLLELDGATSTALSFADLAPSRFAETEAALHGCVILCFLDDTPSRASLLHIRRIKRLAPQTRVGVVIWALAPEVTALETELPRRTT